MRSATRLKIGKDPAYLVWIRSLLCLICFRSVWLEMITRGEVWRMSREHNCYTRLDAGTEAAHVGARGLSQKCTDREAVPLCRLHHTQGVDSHHRRGKMFWAIHELCRAEIIAALNRDYEERRVAA